MVHTPAVYMVTNRPNGTLYVGVTGNLLQRSTEHHEGHGSAFTTQYHLTRLVWYAYHQTMADAIAHEKQLKTWRRAWKVRLILEFNPDWSDLSRLLDERS